jgi:hypothetical protein
VLFVPLIPIPKTFYGRTSNVLPDFSSRVLGCSVSLPHLPRKGGTLTLALYLYNRILHVLICVCCALCAVPNPNEPIRALYDKSPSAPKTKTNNCTGDLTKPKKKSCLSQPKMPMFCSPVAHLLGFWLKASQANVSIRHGFLSSINMALVSLP